MVTAACLFCRLVQRQIPADLVHETDRVLAFHDITPKAPKHLLVIPKEHFTTVGDLAQADPGLAGEVLTVAHLVAKSQDIDESGYRLVFNTGSDGGQSVFHVHCHVLGGRRMTWPPG